MQALRLFRKKSTLREPRSMKRCRNEMLARSEAASTNAWIFSRREYGWIWQRVSTESDQVVESHTAFTTLGQCVSDARQNGHTGIADAHEHERVVVLSMTLPE